MHGILVNQEAFAQQRRWREFMEEMTSGMGEKSLEIHDRLILKL